MRGVKQFILEVVKFIPFAGLVYLLLLLFWGDIMPEMFHINLNYRVGSYGHLFSRINEVKNTHDVDVLFLGSSHTYRGFDTRIFKKEGLKTFNLGSSAQTPSQSYIFLERYLKQLNPKVIIYDTYPFTFESDGIESTLDIISNSKIDRAIIKLAFEQNHIKVYNTLIYGLYSSLLNKNSSFVEPQTNVEDTYIPGGYVDREIEYFKNVEYDKKEWDLSARQLKYFEKVLQLIKENKIQLILVQAPVTKGLYTSYTNNEVFDQKMKSYGEYYNFNEILQLDDSLHFYDVDHLNQNGVEIFDKAVIDLLFKEKLISNSKQE
ncbi:MAG: hypothetical protein ABI663_13790 [Chryseolinea sp.]